MINDSVTPDSAEWDAERLVDGQEEYAEEIMLKIFSPGVFKKGKR
jgi:hypothetical protein